jgi:hypothetical protein
MDGFLDRCHTPKLNKECVNYLKQVHITQGNRRSHKKNSPGPDGFSTDFSQTLKEDLIPIFLKLFHKIKTEVTLPNSFREATIILIPKQRKDHTKKREL